MFLKSREIRDRIIAYKKFFSTQEGKAILHDIMNRFHVLNSHGGDPRLEGQREVALYILSQCNVNLDELDKMLQGDN